LYLDSCESLLIIFIRNLFDQEVVMLKKIAVMFCVLFVGSTAVLFSSGVNEEKVSDSPRSVSVVIQHCTS